MSGRGHPDEIIEFLSWFNALSHPHKVLIAGNHDFLFERDPQRAAYLIPSTVHYLEGRSTTIEGLKIWGGPWQPRFFDWAFNVDRGDPLKRIWKRIPDDTDIVVTHGPPQGIFDMTNDGECVGCEDLGHRIAQIKPILHIF